MTVTVLPRKFRIGATLLADPAPGASPQDAVSFYAGTYPHIAHCQLEEVGPEGGFYVWRVLPPPAQTKGFGPARAPKAGAKATGDALSAIDAWEAASDTADFDVELHAQVGRLLVDLRSRKASPLDPFAIPMA